MSFEKTTHNYYTIMVILLSVTFCLAVYSKPSRANPGIEWHPASLSVEVGQGLSVATTAAFEPSKDIAHLSVRVVPELAPFVSVSPSAFENVKKGDRYTISISVSVPPEVAIGQFDGTIGLREGRRMVAHPLPTIIDVVDEPIGLQPATVDDATVLDPQTGKEIFCGRLLVTVRDGTSLDQVEHLAIQAGARVSGSIPPLNLFVFIVGDGVCDPGALDLAEAVLWQIPAEDAEPFVESVERSSVSELFSVNDPLFPEQWALSTMRAEAAWTVSTGSSKTIAIIDSGIRGTHEEFQGPSSSRVSGHSYFDDSPADEDKGGHGSFVAGIAAASGNNERGIAGVSWHAGLLSFKVFESIPPKSAYRYRDCKRSFFKTSETRYKAAGSESFQDAIFRAVVGGAKIVNMSLGSATTSSAEDQDVELGDHAYLKVLDIANRNGVLVIGAAGNERCDLRSRITPATHPIVMAVAATNRTDEPESIPFESGFSNFGEWVDIAAPGTEIVSVGSGSDEDYDSGQGTSYSAPHVAGAANLVWSENPKWTASQVRLALMLSGRPLANSDRIRQAGFGWGRLDLLNALRAEVAFCDGQCDGEEKNLQGWETTGLWNRVFRPENIRVHPDIWPDLVTLPISLNEAISRKVGLPAAFHGDLAWWYGDRSTGTFIGEFDPNIQSPKGGGTSVRPNSGELISPPIDLRGYQAAGLTFQTWWEIESVDADAFDLLGALGDSAALEVVTSSGTQIVPVSSLNPRTDLNGPPDQPVTSGGFIRDQLRARPPIWVPVFVDLTEYVGDIVRIKWRFSTNDVLYNGFRGWLIDDVSVVGIP